MPGSGTVDTSFYPKLQQPQQPQNPLDMMIKLKGVQDAMGDLAVGRAMQQALQGDGSVDQNVLSGILKQSPAGASKAIPTITALQQMKSAGFASDQAGLETFQKRMAITSHLFSGLASKANPTMQDVYEIAARAMDPGLDAKKYGITMPVIMNAIKAFRNPDGTPMSAQQIKQKALEIQTQAANTSEILGQHSPQVDLVDVGGRVEFVPRGTRAAPVAAGSVQRTLPPGTPIAGREGTRYSGEEDVGQPVIRTPMPSPRPPGAPSISPGPMSGAIMPGQPGSDTPMTPRPVPTTSIPTPAPGVRQPGVRQPAMAALPPGVPEAMTLRSQALTQSANRLTEAADGTPQRVSQLLNLKNFLNDFESGGGADWERKVKNFAIRNVPMPGAWKEAGAWFDPKKLASQEEFAKTATQLMQAQFATIGGTGTDAKFSSAAEASPNELLSTFGNKGIINMLLGNEDAIQAKNRAQQEWISKNGPENLDRFQLTFNAKYDPRVFMLNRMTQPERQAYFERIDPEDIEPLVRKIEQAMLPAEQGGFDLKFTVPKQQTGPKKR